MKYIKLTSDAKIKACEDYLKGWLETHEDDPLSFSEVNNILLDSEDEYDINGNLIEEQE